MIPVTIGAPQYLSYRKKKNVDDEFSRLHTRSITDPQRGAQAAGLGITVGLPKRLNRIFGEGGAGLRVSGYRRIMFSGRSQWSDVAASDVYRQSKFPSLNMEQTYRFDITGTIGTKISVKVSEDSRQNIPLANRLIIRYRGDEDDVLKSIEAGNTTLSLPRTTFVGYSSTIRGLFGVKSEAQIGKLRLIGIASQEQGSSESVSISPTGEESAQYIRDYNYVEARIFDLGDSTDFEPGDSVITLFVYEQVLKKDNSTAQDAILKVEPSSEVLGEEDLPFVRGTDALQQVPEGSYLYFSYPVQNRHYVVFNSSRLQGRALGVYMEVQKEDSSVYTVGDISPQAGEPLLLKLLYHTAPRPHHQTWKLMWRNCYNIPGGILAGDIQIKVFRGSSGNEGQSTTFDYQESERGTQKYIEILGLDQYNERNQKYPDGRVDDLIEVFRPEWGLLIFPHRTPFISRDTFIDASGAATIPLEVLPTDSLIYYYDTPTKKTQSSRYYIQLVTKARSSIIPLGHANIIEGSERVVVNGRLLEAGKDYNIRHDFGQLTLTSEEALDPNADIDIQFEYAPFLAVQKKTLLGMRAEYAWNKNLDFGTTVLYKSDKAQDRKPRVGQETARAVVYDVDGSWRTEATFLTSLVDALPLIETETPSTFRVEGELAQSHPNPNVDGMAYVDDFEAAQEQLSLGLQRTTWKAATQPVQVGPAGWEQGQILWHAPRDPRNVTDIWNIDHRPGEGTIRTLRLVFRPGADPVASKSWAGIMRGFYQRIDAQRAQLLELRAKVSKGSQGRLHIDIGTIDEDLDGDQLATTEDEDNNGVVEEDEDVGLDGLPDNLEPGYHPDTLPDPNGDNWYFLGEGECPLPPGECDKVNWEDESVRYEWLNGTEGNFLDPGWLGIPDEETLTRRGQVRTNKYFSYVIDLGSGIDSFQVEGSERNGWWTYRIPIRDSLALDTLVAHYDDATGQTVYPQWSDVSHVRVWFESQAGQTQYDTVEIAAWYFVQSNWQDSVLYGEQSDSSTSFVVASISEEDGTFDPPPGVEPYEDPNYNVTEKQRGLLLKFDSLAVGDTCLAVKNLISADQYSGYRRLEMYVYGGIEPAEVGKVRFFFRLGKDANNFYEQWVTVDTGWTKRNYINFDFNEITGLKDAALRTTDRPKWNEIDTTAGSYRVRGNPNINDVKFLAAGIVNVDSDRLSGEIWLDELRVTEVRNDVGTAARISFGGTVADLVSYNFSFESQDAFFRGLSSATRGGSSNNLGSGKTTTRIGYGGSLSFHKFLPRSWNASIPISISHSKSTETPLLRSNSDIVLPEDVRQEERSTSESNSFRVSESFAHKGKNPLFNLLLNRLNSSFSYNRSRRRSVTTPYAFAENYSVGSNFNLGITEPPTLPIFFWTKPLPLLKKTSGSRLGLYPNSWTLSGTYNRNLSISDDVSLKRTSSLTRGLTGTMSLKYNVLDNLTTSFGLSTTRDLSDTSQVNFSLKNLRLGLETQYSQSFSANYNPNLFSFLTGAFSYKSSYRDTYSRSSQSRQSAMTRSWSVNGKFEHLKLLGAGKAPRVGRRPRRPGGAGGGEDSGGQESAGPGKPFYDPPLAVLRFLTGWIQPLSYSYNEGFNTTVPGMLARPTWKYRLGFEREADVATVSEGGRTPSSGEDQSYQLSSGFDFLGGISTKVQFRRSITRDLVRQGSRYENISTSWPDLSITIRKFQRFPLILGLINKFIDVFSPRTSYGRQTKEQYDINGGFLKSRSVTISQSPLLSVNFKVLRSLSLSSTYSLTKSEDENFNPTNGDFQSQTRSRRKSISVSTGYKFSAPSGISVPLFGKIRFKSTMDISLDVKKNANKTETRRVGEGWVVSSDASDFAVNTNISYTFSQQIKGGLRAGWQDSSDNFRNRNNHTRTLEGWVEIRF